jgi:hypothetical protein
MYKKHVEGAMHPVLRSLWERGALFLEETSSERLVRDAFPCSLCTHSVKCRIEIEYYPLGRSDGLRARVTSALKYVENCLRAALSVKSRLAVKSLHPEDKTLIDAYFETIFRALNEKRRLEQREAYESLYDAPTQEMSFAGADAIEQRSWENTWRLVENEEAEPATESSIVFAPIEEPQPVCTSAYEVRTEKGIANADGTLVRYLSSVVNGDIAQRKEAVRASDLPGESLAEQVNEIFYSILDDVVLEICDGGAVLIEDYREEVSEWLKMQK